MTGDEVDSSIWRRMIERLRSMKTITDDASFVEPDPFLSLNRCVECGRDTDYELCAECSDTHQDT